MERIFTLVALLKSAQTGICNVRGGQRRKLLSPYHDVASLKLMPRLRDAQFTWSSFSASVDRDDGVESYVSELLALLGQCGTFSKHFSHGYSFPWRHYYTYQKTMIGKIKSCLFSTGKVPANCSSVDVILLPCLVTQPSFQYAQGLHIDTSEIKSEIHMLCNADLVTENNIPRHCEI